MVSRQASLEDDFDAKLRENFIITLFIGLSLSLCTWFLWRRTKRDDVEEPLLCTALSAVSLTAAVTSLAVVPVDQLLQVSPQAVAWFGIDGGRFSQKLASTCLNGSMISMLVLNPFAFLFAEASDGTWRSFWTTFLELLLLLIMLLSLGMLFLTRSTVSDMFFDPTKVISKLLSLIMHIPGCLLIMYHASNAIVDPIGSSISGFVPIRREILVDDAKRLRMELEIMRRSSREGSKDASQALMELQKEISQVEGALESNPLIHNLKTLLYLALKTVLATFIVARVAIPDGIFLRFIGRNSPTMDFVVPVYFLFACLRTIRGSSGIAGFLRGHQKISSESRSQKVRRGHKRNNSLTQLTNTDSTESDDSLSLASFVAVALMLSSSFAVVLTGLFRLNLSFHLPCHPWLLHPYIVVPYCSILLLRAVLRVRKLVIGRPHAD